MAEQREEARLRYIRGTETVNQVAEALQRQSETTMKLSGIVTGAEREKLDMMRRDLEIKERKEAQEAREQESGVKIVMERDAEGLAE